MVNRISNRLYDQFEKLIENNKFMILCTGIVVFWIAVHFFPTSYWYELNKVRVQDSKVGLPISMVVDRAINRDFIGRWSVIVRRMNGGVGEIVCIEAGTNNYKVGAELPEHLTLGWWASAPCEKLDEGFYMVTTIMHIDVPSILQPKIVMNESNIFKVLL